MWAWLRPENEVPVLCCVFPPIQNIRQGRPEVGARMIGCQNALYLTGPSQKSSERS